MAIEVTAQHLGIVGRTGAGKTYTAKGLVEQLLAAGRRVVVLDPTGAWWGLRSRADGTAGFPLPVIGGEHGNVPVQVEHAERLAGWLTEAGKPRSAVVDLSEMLIGERHRFVEVFADALYRHNRAPLHLIIDEADEFCPQNPLPETRRMLHHVDRIVRRGRIRGFRVMLITQRPAVLHKNVLTQINALVALRLTAPQDRKAIEAWVEGQADAKKGREVLDTLARLQRGEGWVWAPELDVLERVTFPPIETYDSSRSPEHGDELVEPAAADVDLAGLKELLADEEPATPAASAGAAPAVDTEAQAFAVRQAADEAYERGRREAADEARAQGFADARLVFESQVELMIAELSKQLEWIRVVAPGAPAAPAPERLGGAQSASLTEPEGEPRTVVSTRAEASPGAGAELRVLKVLAQRHPAKFSAAQWATLARMKRTGGTWNTYVSRLKTRGLIERDGEIWRCTAAGLKAAGKLPPAPRGTAAVVDAWCEALGGGAAKMLRYLVEHRGRPVDRANLADRLGMTATGGTFNTYLSRLRSNGLAVVEGRRVRAADVLFEE
jgi:hypothetical protein